MASKKLFARTSGPKKPGKKTFAGKFREQNLHTCRQTSGEDIAAENVCKEKTHADKFPEKKSSKKH